MPSLSMAKGTAGDRKGGCVRRAGKAIEEEEEGEGEDMEESVDGKVERGLESRLSSGQGEVNSDN